MKAIKELILLPDTPFTAGTTGDAFYNPVIRGFSSDIEVTNTPNGPSLEQYIKVDLQEYSTNTAYQHRGVLVNGYIKPINQNDPQGNDSKRIGLPFTHFAMLVPNTNDVEWDIFIEEHTTNSSPSISFFSIYNIEQCFGTTFTPSDHLVEYEDTFLKFHLKLLGGNNDDRNYRISGVYYLI